MAFDVASVKALKPGSRGRAPNFPLRYATKEMFQEAVMTFVAAMILALSPVEGLSLALQDQDRIQDLIRKLGSDDFATREQASEELKKAGKPAREALQKAAEESEDPEVRQRSKSILEELAKPAPRKAVPLPPGRLPAVRGMSFVSVSSVNGDTTYTITPGDGSPVLKFFKGAAGAVKLDYVDEKGESKAAEAASLEGFLKDNKELAQKFGITEEGIDYAGSRVSFKPQPARGFRFNLPQQPRVPPPPAPLPEEDPEFALIGGALLAPVDDSLRAQLEIPEGQGAVVSKVTAGSVAEALGLKKNDVLLEIDGKKITSPESAKGLIRKGSSPVVLRKGKKETLPAKKDF